MAGQDHAGRPVVLLGQAFVLQAADLAYRVLNAEFRCHLAQGACHRPGADQAQRYRWHPLVQAGEGFQQRVQPLFFRQPAYVQEHRRAVGTMLQALLQGLLGLVGGRHGGRLAGRENPLRLGAERHQVLAAALAKAEVTVAQREEHALGNGGQHAPRPVPPRGVAKYRAPLAGDDAGQQHRPVFRAVVARQHHQLALGLEHFPGQARGHLPARHILIAASVQLVHGIVVKRVVDVREAEPEVLRLRNLHHVVMDRARRRLAVQCREHRALVARPDYVVEYRD